MAIQLDLSPRAHRDRGPDRTPRLSEPALPAARPSPTALRVGLVGADDLTRCGLGALLARYADRVTLVESLHPLPSAVDLLLVDARAAGSRERVRRHVTAGHDLVVAFGNGQTAGELERLVAVGARGYLCMQLPASDLVLQLERHARLPDVGPEPVLPSAPQLASLWAWGLTPREAEVLTLITRGLTNQQIAEELFLGINTVKTYIRGAYRKVGVERRSQAVVWAIEHGAARG